MKPGIIEVLATREVISATVREDLVEGFAAFAMAEMDHEVVKD